MARIQMHSARTAHTEPSRAAEDLLARLNGDTPKLVTLFASRALDHHALNRELRARLPQETRLIGATTSAGIDQHGIHAAGAVLGALSGDFEVALGIGRGLSVDAMSAGEKAMDQARNELGIAAADIDPKRHVGLVIDDGFRDKKEELLLGVLEKNPALLLVGGGASDAEMDPAKRSALLHVDGEVASDAALVALFRTNAPFAALRSHSYAPTGKTTTVTKLDDNRRRVLELDGKPAAQRYAELLDTDIEGLAPTRPTGVLAHPLALRVGREYFMRSTWSAEPDGSVLFAHLLEENTNLEVMDYVGLAETTRRFFEEELPRRVRNPQAVLLFNCGGRSWLASMLGESDKLSEAFCHAPAAAGMNVWFEIYCGFHIGSTLTVLAFGASE